MLPHFCIEDIIQGSQKKDAPRFSQLPSTTQKQGVTLHPKAADIIQSSFIMGLMGNPGSGKSTLLQKLISQDQFYGRKFQRVLFIGPTKYSTLIQDQYNTKKCIDIGWIYKQIQQANKWKCRSMLLVFDDVVSSLKGCATNQKFVDLFYNRRHLLINGTISIAVGTQKWNLVPTFIRSAYTSLVIFNISKTETDLIAKEVAIPYSGKQKDIQFVMDITVNPDPHWCDQAGLFTNICIFILMVMQYIAYQRSDADEARITKDS